MFLALDLRDLEWAALANLIGLAGTLDDIKGLLEPLSKGT
jgi:hypothetical protein